MDIKPKLGLEVGLGSRRVGSPLSNRIHADLVGLDLSKEMLLLAAKKVRHSEKLSFVVGDAEFLPFSNETFDFLLCISVFHYFVSAEKALIELFRVIKNNGLFVCGDVTMHELDKERFLDELEKASSPAHTTYYKPTEIEQLFKTQGFKSIKTKTIPYKKSCMALVEDRAKYFEGKTSSFYGVLEKFSRNKRKLYEI